MSVGTHLFLANHPKPAKRQLIIFQTKQHHNPPRPSSGSISNKRGATSANMSTLVDELLQDFEDSGSEQGDDHNEDDFLGGDNVGSANDAPGEDDMDLDGGAVQEDDEEMGGVPSGSKQAPEDPEEAKARIEKMQLKGVDDVSSVARLMKSLEPVLKVS